MKFNSKLDLLYVVAIYYNRENTNISSKRKRKRKRLLYNINLNIYVVAKSSAVLERKLNSLPQVIIPPPPPVHSKKALSYRRTYTINYLLNADESCLFHDPNSLLFSLAIQRSLTFHEIVIFFGIIYTFLS